MAYDYNDPRRDLVFDESQLRTAADIWAQTLPDRDRPLFNTTFKEDDPSRFLALSDEEAEEAARQWAEDLPDR